MFGKSVRVIALVAVLGGCSHAGSITHTSADYNKAMATVRNEQLLLNMMRAAAREPLQFSAMGEINTTFDRTAELDSNFNNLIVGGVNAITQVLKLTGSNRPVVKIAPLSNREFISGMLRPTTPETLKQFMDLGWDAEFMLPLLVRGYRCPNATSFTWLSGSDANLQTLVSRLSNAGSGARWATARSARKQVELQVADDKALEMLRSGVAAGFRVDSIRAGSAPGMSIITLLGSETSTTTLQLPLCKTAENDAQAVANADGQIDDAGASALTSFTIDDHSGGTSLAPKALEPDGNGQIAFRSVEGIIYFLGERLRHCYLERAGMEACALTYGKAATDPAAPARTKYLLHIIAGAKPAETAVGANYYGANFWVARLDRADDDLAFLNQLIALQTEASATGSTTTVLAVGGR
ncbi:MAG: hypothetical protein ABIS38_06470 [Sphingomicrobium sp.]